MERGEPKQTFLDDETNCLSIFYFEKNSMSTFIQSPIHLYRILLKHTSSPVYKNEKARNYLYNKIRESFRDTRNKDPAYQQLQYQRAVQFLTVSSR